MQNKARIIISKCIHQHARISHIGHLARCLQAPPSLPHHRMTCADVLCSRSIFTVGALGVGRTNRMTKRPACCKVDHVIGVAGAGPTRRRNYSSLDGIRKDWDSYGTWGNRIEEPILLQQSIKHGIPIPKISISNVGQESLIGRRLTNEDRIRIVELAPNLLYFGIFDGHGGATAADYTCSNLEHHIEYWIGKEHDLQVVLDRAFEDVENQFARYLHMELRDPSVENSGTTATVCLVRNGNELVVGNVGDSRAILCRKGKSIRLTRDHEPEVESERERIEAAKGFISWNSHGKPLVNGALAMTRSIGDEPLKRYGVIAQPETKSVEIRHSKDNALILATDGIISVMTDQEICDSVSRCHDPPTAANFVADQALQFGSEDNASIVVVPLGRWGYQAQESSMHTMRWFERSKY